MKFEFFHNFLLKALFLKQLGILFLNFKLEYIELYFNFIYNFITNVQWTFFNTISFQMIAPHSLITYMSAFNFIHLILLDFKIPNRLMTSLRYLSVRCLLTQLQTYTSLIKELNTKENDDKIMEIAFVHWILTHMYLETYSTYLISFWDNKTNKNWYPDKGLLELILQYRQFLG